MDRGIVYPGSIPLDTDLLFSQRSAMVAVGALSQAVLGQAPVLDGFECAPAAAGEAVVIGPGSLSALATTDSTAYGSMPPDHSATVKTGLSRQNVTLQLGTWPDPGAVLCWLVQAALQEIDSGAVALPYWNAADPTVPFTGPANSGAAQNTQRLVRVVLTAKSSGPLPVGTFAPPAPDPGWVGLYGVTTSVGKNGVSAEDIVRLPAAPFLPFRLPELAPGFSRQSRFTSNAVWSVPMGVQRLRVRLVGAGGGGGGGSASFGGGGGGAGGYAEAILAVQSGQGFAVTVGTGGAAAPPNVTGGSGGASSFGSLVQASGGEGGASSNPDSHGGAGGAGLAGQLLLLGGYGGDGPVIAGVPAGNGGCSAFGGGGRGSNFGGPPADGKALGSGAGGGYGANASGGIGASGLVIVEY